MQVTRPRSLVIVWMTACVALNAAAMGLGSGGANPMMGQPLNFPVQLRVDPGEVLEPGCVSAEVTVGDRRLPAGLVRAVLETSAREVVRVRVLTSVSIDEPVIGVLLTAGCQARVSRSFVLLADPPLTPAAAVAPVDVATLLPAATAAAADSGAAATPQQTAATAAYAQNNPNSPTTANTNAGTERPAPAARVVPRDPAAEARAEARRIERRQARAAARRAKVEAARTAAEAARVAAAANPAPAAPVARLLLDPVDAAPSANPVAVEQALAAVAEAASAARAAADAASASAQRIATLERTVEQLRSEAKAGSELNSQLRARLLDADGAGRWTGPLLAALLLLGGLAAWLAWRLAELQRLRQTSWREASARAAVASGAVAGAPGTAPGTLPGAAPAGPPSQQMTAPIPFVTSEIMAPAAAPALRPRTAPAWPPPAPGDNEPEPAMQRTEVLPPGLRPDAGAARDVSIEELLDLEQQAEFFVVLGQDESAIDLLVDHLRNTGGGSPLPYLKLLEIYRRRGDREAYDRTRSRFNDRFNAYAPDWDTDLQQGRALDDYPGVIPRLQQVWSRPMDAMAELEALLFRKSRGELFDLPAYREVLFLYSLARDLLDRESLDSGTVDLLLPLTEGGDYGSTTPHPDFSGDAEGDRGRSDEMATAPIDLDLTQGEQRSSSIFGRLDGERKHSS